MTMSLTQILQNTLAIDLATRKNAEGQLTEFSNRDFAGFATALCQELASPTSPVRQSAGLLLKNQLSAKDFERQNEYSQRWLSIDEGLRSQLKHAILLCLTSESSDVGKASGQLVASIANIELELNLWPTLITDLLNMVTSPESTAQIKKNTIQCIGYVCESTTSEILSSQSNAILTAVAEGARKEQESPAVRLVALQALINSLAFIQVNFGREDERNYVMQIVCEATQTEAHPEIQVLAFECLVKIVGLYYDHMGMYMQKALYGLTVLGMRHQNPDVVLQAIEFWSTICEIEYDRSAAASEDLEADEGVRIENTVLHFAAAAMNDIVDVLLEVMAKQQLDEDGDEWTPSMAAATCLQLMASVAGSPIVAKVLPFIEKHIQDADWRLREASCMAFGSIIEGPDPTEMAKMVTLALPVLVRLVSDPELKVKDTAAWTLGRICENLLEVIQPNEFSQIVEAIIGGLNDNPKIAGSCAWSITCLAEQLGTKDSQQETSKLSIFFPHLLQALLTAINKQNQDQSFKMSAFEAISVLIENSAKDASGSIEQFAQGVLQQLQQLSTVNPAVMGDEERRAHYQLQANLCGLLTSIIHYNGSIVKVHSDFIMNCLGGVVNTASKESTVKEEAFVAIGAVAGAMEIAFYRYMDSVMPLMYACLQNHEDYAVCAIVLGVLGDICRALGEQVYPFATNIINHIAGLLNIPDIHRKIKPAALSAIGDLSLAIGGQFEIFVHPTMEMILRVSNQLNTIPQNTQEQFEYVFDTREAIAEAYIGICQGLKQANKGNLLLNYSDQIFTFLEVCTADTDKSEGYVKIMMGLLGDLADTLPVGHQKNHFGSAWVATFIKDVKNTKQLSADTKNYARWTRELIRRQC